MICYACRIPHNEKPEGCWNCPCQHRPESPRPKPVENTITGWLCKGCDTVVDEHSEECDCLTGGTRLPLLSEERA